VEGSDGLDALAKKPSDMYTQSKTSGTLTYILPFFLPITTGFAGWGFPILDMDRRSDEKGN
jgi:hypothetical protein